MTRANAGTRQLAINLPATTYLRLQLLGARQAISMTHLARRAIDAYVNRQLGRPEPEVIPELCPGSGGHWGMLPGGACCPGCTTHYRQLGLARRPNRQTTTVPDHRLLAAS